MRVNAKGQPVQDADHYFHTRQDARRKRRSLEKREEQGEQMEEEGNEQKQHDQQQKEEKLAFPSKVFYQIQAFGRAFHLELTPDEDFISPHLVVEHVDREESWLDREEDLPVGTGCFHRGAVRGDSSSDVVVSICDSMVSDSLSTTIHF